MVDGVERDPAMAREAAPWCRTLWVADLETLDLEEAFAGVTYDYVICADVLEHLRDPGKVLSRIHSLLQPGAQLLVSVPNVAHTGVLLALAEGAFPYRHEGLLDITHLRFFTRSSFLDLLVERGFSVCDLDRVVLPLPHTEFADFAVRADPRLLALLASRADAEVYQYVLAAEAVSPPSEPVGGSERN